MIILLVIVGISLLILIHELGHFLAAKAFGLLVEEFGFGFPPRLFSKKIGETVYSFNILPFGGFVKIYGEESSVAESPEDRKRAFYAQRAWRRILIILAGVAMNFLLGWFIISAIFMVGVPKSIVVTDVAAGSPAAMIGIQKGDQITGFKDSEEFTSFVQQNRGREITLLLKRDGEQFSVGVVPRIEAPAGQGALGIAFAEAGVDRQPVLASFWSSLKASVGLVSAIFTGLYQLLLALFTQGQLLPGFVGPVGIFGIASQAAGLGILYFLQLLALISLNLFALNILPFPALDGGRLLFVLIEKIKGSPLSPQFEKSANAFGFLLLLLLMLALTVRDVARLF